MLICGIKYSHDGAVAFIDAGERPRLLAGIEVEKFQNGPRRGAVRDEEMLLGMMAAVGVQPSDVHRLVVDGWGDEARGYPCEVELGDEIIPTAPYVQTSDTTRPLHRYTFGHYESYRHVEGHLASAYGTRPESMGDDVGVLVWDGAMYPQLYRVGADVQYLGVLFPVRSCVFEKFGSHIPPFVPDPRWSEGRLDEFNNDNAGKMMAYAGLGKAHDDMVGAIKDAWGTLGELPPHEPGVLFDKVAPVAGRLGLDGPSIFASFQRAVGDMLIGHLYRFRHLLPDTLCFVGGAALNIKWNSMIRDSCLFREVWVPPFPNDSGSAIGAAYASLMNRGVRAPLDWSAYAGPRLQPCDIPTGWITSPCTVEQLAELLHTSDRPVAVISGRAELGPRALGHRSILAAPVEASMKALLNDIKGREQYRPVAPICLEEDAPAIFDPGTPDPYMLFDHKVRPAWVERIPAVLHLDGTARLQTVKPGCLPYEIVAAYKRLTGIPVLCNTSANYPGKGFFPDVRSALEWGRTHYVWSEGRLYERKVVVKAT